MTVSSPPRTSRIPGNPFVDGDGDGRSTAGAPRPTLFRALNEEVHRLADSFGFEGELDLICECERAACRQRIAVSRDAYEAVRRFPTRFLLNGDHIGADDRIVDETDGYVVVEKIGPSAESAILLDPRRQRRDSRSR